MSSTYTTEVPCIETTPATAPNGAVPFPSVNVTGIPASATISSTGVTTISYSSSVVVTTITSIPPASTIVSGTTGLGSGPTAPVESCTTTAPTNIPIAPTTSPGVVTINGARKAGSGAGILGAVVGVAAFVV